MTTAEAIDDELSSLVRSLQACREGSASASDIRRDAGGFAVAAAHDLVGRSPEEAKELRDRALERLLPLIGSSRVLEAVRQRDAAGARGFPLLLRALQNEPGGADPAAAAFDAFLLACPALSALRARRLFFRRELEYRFANVERGQQFRVLAFGSGPLCEIVDFLECLGPDAARVHATLIDGDAASLESAKRRASAGGFARSLTAHGDDPQRVALFGGSVKFGLQDFVYSPFVLDFAPDDVVERCLRYAFQQLAKGGMMVFGHYNGDLTPADRVILEWWIEWFPYFRPPQDLSKMVRKSLANRASSAVGLVRGPNVYVVVERKGE